MLAIVHTPPVVSTICDAVVGTIVPSTDVAPPPLVGDVAPGAVGTEVDRVARTVIEEAGLGARFGHGLGHGVGLEVHEAPWLNPELESTLAVGNVVTVEPGVYISGLGGIRIEDLVILGEDGPDVLTDYTKELVVVG